jgi:glycosyltransferase involved in cell wall biosynthesis
MYPKAKWVETNIFGFNDESPERQMDFNIYISEFIRKTALNASNEEGTVLYNPIEVPVLDMTPKNKLLCREALLRSYNLPDDAILLGRVGRADNFDPIALRAMERVEKEFDNVYYIVVNPCENWMRVSDDLGLRNVRFAEPIIDDGALSAFYRGLDIYAHARSDGECCPCNIQEAMMHGLPIVSHESAIYNGQSEIIGDAGFCVPIGDHDAYADCLIGLIANENVADEDEHIVPIRYHFGRAARRRAMRYFEAETTTSKLVGIYDWVLENK